MNARNGSLWTIVLAAGEGTRLRSLTRALHAEDLPKQFATLQGNRSMLEVTVDRATEWSRAEQTVVVVARGNEVLAASQLRGHAGVDIVGQPRNLGTGPGLMLPLARILAKEPSARVVVLPSDQHVRDGDAFAGAVRRADESAVESNRVVLLGAVPDKAEEQYGWIVPRIDIHARGYRVAAFREKPSAATAESLRTAGALWSTFVMTGPVREFWRLSGMALPDQGAAFERYRRAIGTWRERPVLDAIYARMAPSDFSREVLEKAPELGVVLLPPCGWSDWGTPARVFESLKGTTDFAALVRRLGVGARSFPELESRGNSSLPRSHLHASACSRWPATRSAFAMMVSAGFTAALEGKKLESAT